MALVQHTVLEFSISTNVEWIVMQFGTVIHGPPRMNLNDSVDPPSIYLAPPIGKNCGCQTLQCLAGYSTRCANCMHDSMMLTC